MAVVKVYEVVLDEQLDLVSVKNLGTPPVRNRKIQVLGESQTDAIKRAKAQITVRGDE